ncbi:MAG: 1-acyl-sn-glycerol-3-phosphate acyltransferase [Campylobacteraceae bacterium 4484_166]|nr:MAG: 1-acyl-sn-glycerol-3-phosphate acyltransferase [Campylobacteraceae bacterium 4484_166]
MSTIRYLILMLQFVFTVSFTILLMFLFNKHNHKIRKTWAKIQLKFLGIKLVFDGKMSQEAKIFVFNHQSLLDIIIFEAISKENLAWIAKKQIANLPFLGQILKLPDMIIIDRENKTGLIKLLKETKRHLEINKRPIAIFPEGTRSSGKQMLKFKQGAKLIANKYEAIVQPIVISGSRDCVDSLNLKASSGTVYIKYMDTIKASKDSLWFEDMEKDMNSEFEKLQRL